MCSIAVQLEKMHQHFVNRQNAGARAWNVKYKYDDVTCKNNIEFYESNIISFDRNRNVMFAYQRDFIGAHTNLLLGRHGEPIQRSHQSHLC